MKRWPRYKAEDDATIVLVDFATDTQQRCLS